MCGEAARNWATKNCPSAVVTSPDVLITSSSRKTYNRHLTAIQNNPILDSTDPILEQNGKLKKRKYSPSETTSTTASTSTTKIKNDNCNPFNGNKKVCIKNNNSNNINDNIEKNDKKVDDVDDDDDDDDDINNNDSSMFNDTVGAVCWLWSSDDNVESVASCVSSGGICMKTNGRIGEAGLIGVGCDAKIENDTCMATSCSGNE